MSVRVNAAGRRRTRSRLPARRPRPNRRRSPYRNIPKEREPMVSDLENQLLALDARLEEAQKNGRAIVSAIARTRAAVKVGRINDITKGLNAIAQQVTDAKEAAGGLGSDWGFDAPAYMADGRFLADLEAAAAEKGLRLFEKNGRIYCFPLLMRIDPKEAAVKIGKTLERRIRPSELVRILTVAQKRPQQFREERFLELLYRTWRLLLAGTNAPAARNGPVMSLAEIHETLTLFPGTDYPIEEFTRDLLLLDRKPDLRTRDGSCFEFAASTLSKGQMRRLVVYDEEGGERTYVGVRFVKEG
jgi:hypothetical protein